VLGKVDDGNIVAVKRLLYMVPVSSASTAPLHGAGVFGVNIEH
jgi:hypothetical protein